MTKVEVEDISTVKKKLTVEVPKGDVLKEIDDAYRSIKGSADLPGFRKGKVPDKILKQHYGAKVMGEVATRLLERTYSEAVKDKGLSPVDRPEVEVRKVGEGEPFVYTATVEVAPVVSVAGYRGLDLKRVAIEVTPGEVDEGLKRLRESRGEFKEVTREAVSGDLAVVDFTGFIDDEPIKGGAAKDFSVMLGEGHLLPGFDEAITGTKAGAEVTVDTAFPETYQETGVAGKKAHFKVKLKSVKERNLPNLDDEFAKDLECETLAALKEKVRGDILKVKEKEDSDRLRIDAMDLLIEKNTFDVPTSLVERYLANILSSVAEDMKRGAAPPDELGKSVEELKERYRVVAEKRVRADIMVDAIAEKEGVEVSKDDIHKALDEMAKRSGSTADAIRARLEKEGSMGAVEESLRRDKVFEILTESRVVV